MLNSIQGSEIKLKGKISDCVIGPCYNHLRSCNRVAALQKPLTSVYFPFLPAWRFFKLACHVVSTYLSKIAICAARVYIWV